MLVDHDFATEISKAKEQSEVYFAGRIKKAAGKDQYWRAAAWILERRHPHRYGSRSANTFTAEQVKSLISRIAELIVSEVSDPQERKRIREKIQSLVTDKAPRASNPSTDTEDEHGEEEKEQ